MRSNSQAMGNTVVGGLSFNVVNWVCNFSDREAMAPDKSRVSAIGPILSFLQRVENCKLGQVEGC